MTLKMYTFTIIIVLFGLLKLTSGNLCKICLCYKSDGMTVFDCDKKLNNNISDLNSLLYLNNVQLDKFILSNNGLDKLSLEPLKTIKDMRIINLTNNLLNETNFKLIDNWNRLDNLDLSFNQWTIFNIELLINVSSLLKLDLSHNFIDIINPTISSKQIQLNHLDLSYNKFTAINQQFFNNFSHLKYLNLSFNSIETIDYHSLNNLSSLIFLSLNNNHLKILNINFPLSLMTLIINYNELCEFPRNLSVNYLSIDNNRIKNILIYNKSMLKQLEYLNISRNLLSKFVNDKFSYLTTLDISYNNFTNIPAIINEKNLPKLDTFIINGNPMSNLKFNSHIKLRNFIARNISLLNKIDADTFVYLKEYDNDCINITISFNEKLMLFDEKSIDNITVCYLDLANNSLRRISQHMKGLQDKLLFKYGLNLQGNPLVCDCASQWMLNSLIPKLYDLNPELLINLRCNEPQELSNVRIVHWYKWKSQIFCDNHQAYHLNDMTNESMTIHMETMTSTIVIETSKTMLIVIISCAIILAILVLSGMILSLKFAYKKRRENRRF